MPEAEALPALAELAARSYRAAFDGLVPEPALARRTPAVFLARFEADRERVRAVFRDGVPLGYSLMRDGHLDLLFLEPGARGRGVGAALLADAVARGCRSLECFAANAPARRFYERLGWRLATTYRRELDGFQMEFVRYELPGDGA